MKKTPLDFTDRIRVVANVHDLDTNRYLVEIEFRDIQGNGSNALLPRSIIRSGVNASNELLDRGANIPTGAGAGAQLASLLSVIPDRTYRITAKAGWHGQSFVLPDITIGPDADTLIHASRKAGEPVQPATAGSLKGWLAGLKEPCCASSYLTFGIAAAFAAPLLHLVGQDEGAIFYLTGESSIGKTLTELAALSAIERAVRDSLLTHDATDRSIEEDCAAHNDLLQVIDELLRMTGSQAEGRAKVRRLAHKITGGGGSRRSAKARQDPDLADLRWRVTCLWSGEYSLGPKLLGDVRSRGELVRLIEIPVPERKDDGIFDRLSAVQRSRTKLVRRAEAAVAENFGHAIRAFLALLVSKRQLYAQRARELIDGFLERVGPGSDPWMRRFASKFAVVYAAAKIAAELGVAPWSPSHPFKCIERLYTRARGLIVTPEEVLTGLLDQLANNASSADRFPKVQKGDSLPKHLKTKAWGIRHKTQDGVSCLAIESERFERLVHPAHYAGRVRKLLADGGYTVPGKEGRHVCQIKVKGFGSTEKPYFVCVRLDRLPRVEAT
jgi:putative DNA primase/helicase